MISIIVAFDKNRLIGRSDGSLPWHIVEDFKQFKSRTMGHTVIMGLRTWDSLPIKPLPGRLNIVLDDRQSLSMCWQDGKGGEGWFIPNWQEALSLAERKGVGEVFIIGGRMVYASALEQGIVDKMYVSLIHGEHEGDVYFPEISDEWKWELKEKYKAFDLYELTKP